MKATDENKTSAERAAAFTSIFVDGGWAKGGGETVSGAGSTANYTDHIRDVLPVLFKGLGVESMVDAPCGDFNWMKLVDLGEINYTGIDIVAEIVAQNKEKYAETRRQFLNMDIVEGPLPRADILFCRDLFRHIPLEDTQKVLNNFVEAGTSFLLATSYTLKKNKDTEGVYGSRPVDLRLEPFHLPKPMLLVPDWVEGFKERFLCLWSREQIAESVANSAG